MAFYPTWQTATATDPSQSWQNQFIQQQIPATNGSAATSVTAIAPLEFQPQVFEDEIFVQKLFF